MSTRLRSWLRARAPDHDAVAVPGINGDAGIVNRVAARQGDLVVEVGPPNAIVLGAQTVLIG